VFSFFEHAPKLRFQPVRQFPWKNFADRTADMGVHGHVIDFGQAIVDVNEAQLPVEEADTYGRRLEDSNPLVALRRR
jgi:hypothetical protein